MKIQEITDKIIKRISDYVEFDIYEAFDQSDYITIYGGAVRDSIAGLDIHDVDILCMSESAIALRNYIVEHCGYKNLDLYDLDSINMYKGISLISEPWTFINSNNKIIQIIRPNYTHCNGIITNYNNYNNITSSYIKSYVDLIKNVDLSCCGVYIEKIDMSIDNSNNKKRIILKESCKNAISHCLSKSFEINNWAKLYNQERTLYREWKLENRGWFNLYPTKFGHNQNNNILKHNRHIKISLLELESDYNYKMWTDYEYSKHEKKTNIDYPF